MSDIHPELQELIDMGYVKVSLQRVNGKGFTLMCSLTERGKSLAEQLEDEIDDEELELFLSKSEKDLEELCNPTTSEK